MYIITRWAHILVSPHFLFRSIFEVGLKTRFGSDVYIISILESGYTSGLSKSTSITSLLLITPTPILFSPISPNSPIAF